MNVPARMLKLIRANFGQVAAVEVIDVQCRIKANMGCTVEA